MKNKSYKDFCVSENITLVEAMRRMNVNGQRTLFITDDVMRLKGALSVGDIRRWILESAGKLDIPIGKITNYNPIYLYTDYNLADAREKMLDNDITIIPILNQDKTVVDILLWTDIFGEQKRHAKIHDSPSVVIMAGGIGSRMQPFTNILPKPLLPIKDKPVVEVIMDRFYSFGITDFHMVVNFKKGMIISYFENTSLPYKINFVDEGELLGTCGGLSKIPPEKLSDNFFLTNCDSIIDADYSEIYNYHKSKQNHITVISTVRDFKIPYGVIEIANDGNISRIEEKPTFNFLVNTGTYILNKKVLDIIPKGKKFETTNLINKIIENGEKAGLFPLDPEARLDTGEWAEYHKTVEVFKAKSSTF